MSSHSFLGPQPNVESGVHINHYKNGGALTSETLSWKGSCSSGGEESRGQFFAATAPGQQTLRPWKLWAV